MQRIKSKGKNGGEMKMTEQTQTNKFLDAVAWGVFIVLLGASWIASSYYKIDTGIYLALGTGLILIALNLTRRVMEIRISKFSLFIGLLALALSLSGIVGYELSFIPTVIVLVGFFIVAEAIQKTIHKKPTGA
jgi:hypothetical protein